VCGCAQTIKFKLKKVSVLNHRLKDLNILLNEIEINCINACNDCARSCLQCSSGCLKESNVKDMVGCIALDMECANICHLVATSIAQGHSHTFKVCKLCLDILEKCVSECSKHSMAHCKKCVQACNDCASACRAMLH